MAKSPLQQNFLSHGCMQQASVKVSVSSCLAQHRLTCTPPVTLSRSLYLTSAVCAYRFLNPTILVQHLRMRWSYQAHLSAGTRSRTGALSFASAPLFEAPRQRLQDRLRVNRRRLRVAHARWKLHSQAWKQRGLQQLQRHGSQARPSVLVESTTMHFIRRARQAYQFVPSVAMR